MNGTRWAMKAALLAALLLLGAASAMAVWQDELIYSHGAGLAAQSDLAIRWNGELHVSIYQRAGAIPGSRLGYARKVSPEANWVNYDLHWNPNFYEGSMNSIGLVSNDEPRIAYRRFDSDFTVTDIRTSWSTGSGWTHGPVGSPDGFGGGPTLVMDSDGTALIYYGDPALGLVEARKTTAGWDLQTVLPGQDSQDYMVARRHHDEILVAYFHVFTVGEDVVCNLRLATRSGGVWQDELVDDQPHIDSLLGLGLAVDPDGVPHLVYTVNGAANYRIEHAWKSAAAWEIEDLASSSSSATRFLWPDIAADPSGQLHVAHSVDISSGSRYELVVLRGTAGSWQEDHRLSQAGRRFEMPHIGVDLAGLRHIIYFNGPSSPWETRHLWNDEPLVITVTPETPFLGLPSRILAASPNPFNPTTTIELVLAAPGRVRLDVLDVQGRRLRQLADEWRAAGPWRVEWDGRDDDGLALGSGLYLVRFQAQDGEDTRKLVLIK